MTNHERAGRSAEAGNRPNGRLTAILAHELRSPLASILSALHVMRHGRVDEAAARLARDRAERQARHMALIIEDVLDVCRGGHGSTRLRKERVNLAAVVIDAVETAHPHVASRGHHLAIALPPESVSLLADPSRLHQILTNLLTNAAQYTDPGGKICLAADVAGDEVVLRVSDNGMGIPPEMLPRIFDLFQRGDRAGERARGGLGIGLAVVKSLVQMHGGSVAAFSQGTGTGSELVVRLPDCDPKNEGGRVPEVFAAVFSAGVAVGPWLRLSDGHGWPMLLAAAAVAVTALLQFFRWNRARSVGRWQAALDAYVAREIARDRRRRGPPP